MNRKQTLKLLLILTLAVLSLGGWLLHFRIHNPVLNHYGLLPFTVGAIAVLVIPFLFWSSQTISYAYVINEVLVIIGTIAMAHFSIAHFKPPLTLYNIIFNTLFPDIVLLWASLAVGKAIFELELFKSDQDVTAHVSLWNYFRYPNFGWVLVHFITMGTVYTLGHLLWR